MNYFNFFFDFLIRFKVVVMVICYGLNIVFFKGLDSEVIFFYFFNFSEILIWRLYICIYNVICVLYEKWVREVVIGNRYMIYLNF